MFQTHGSSGVKKDIAGKYNTILFEYVKCCLM